jgi:hypothetical protein
MLAALISLSLLRFVFAFANAERALPSVAALPGGYSLRLGKTGDAPSMLNLSLPDEPDRDTRSFTFDQAYGPEAGQAEIFEKVSGRCLHSPRILSD